MTAPVKLTDAQWAALAIFDHSTNPRGAGLALWQVSPVRHATVVALWQRDNRWLGEVQSRKHRFAFGTRASDDKIGRRLHYETAALENAACDYRVCASDFARTRPVRKLAGGVDKRTRKGALCQRGSRKLADALALQGLPRDFFDESPFTVKDKGEMLGNRPCPL
jgi:hypothetical protein